MGGFGSVDAHWRAAKRIVDDADHVTERTVIHVIGDYDPSGWHLARQAIEDVAAFAAEMGHEVIGNRVAVTEVQIARFGLATYPAKASDARSFPGVSGDGTTTCQAEAMQPADLQAEVEAVIRANWLDTIEDVRAPTLARDRAKLAELSELLLHNSLGRSTP